MLEPKPIENGTEIEFHLFSSENDSQANANARSHIKQLLVRIFGNEE